MRLTTLCLTAALLALAGCSSEPKLRDEPVDVKGTVKLPGGASPKDLTVTFQPQQNALPGGSKVAADGTFAVKLVPGKYVVYFHDESNANVPAYKKLPASYRQPSEENVVTVEAGKSLDIDVK